MVTVLVPVVARLLTVKVSVLVLVAGLVANDEVTPLPRPEADKVTLPLKPLDGVIVIFAVACDDWSMVKLVGEADSAKLPEAGAVTVRVTVAVRVMAPPLPVTVIV
jgi:hypothetical protein